MNWLFIDGGNSRLKWALLRQPYRRARPFDDAGVLELSNLRLLRTGLLRLLTRAGPQAALHVCNVAGAPLEQALRAAAARAGLRAPVFLRSTTAAGGIRNGYAEPWRLGADRWAALIGAHHDHPARALCVVSVGTALTIDLLDAGGQHLGGSIVPGPQLMIDSLLRGTAGIRRRAGAGTRAVTALSSGLYARDTRAALIAGSRYAGAGLLQRALDEARVRLGVRPRLLLGGGGADLIAPLLHGRHWRSDDLVLRGLAVLAAGTGRDAR